MGLPAQPNGIAGWLVGGAIKTMLSAIASTVDAGAAEALRLTGSLLNSTTNPGLASTWFSATYWRVAALSALLTVPFLFAAAVHALVRSDVALLGRAAFGYLPLAAIGVTIAAPLATLLLSATDEMCGIVADAAGNADGAALTRAAAGVVSLSAMVGNPMLAFFLGLLAVIATIGLWIELLIRAAAVDVIVLMLPLFFAAMVWPARRVWAVRAIETLVALILAKFAVVAVLTLGGAAFGGRSAGLDATLVGATLIVLAVLSPWALLRLLPLHEVAAAAAGGLSQAPHAALHSAGRALYDGMRAVGGGAANGGEIDATPGLNAEDDGRGAVARTDASWAPGRGDTGAAGAWRAGGGGATGVTSATRRFDPETAAGLAVVERADGRSTSAGDPPGPAPGAAVTGLPPDDRPPIDEMFGDVEWEGFVIGDDGDEVMAPPRFDSGEPAPPVPDRSPEES